MTSNSSTINIEKPVASAARRITGRSFPSVFQAWNRADNLPGESLEYSLSRHDLIFHGPQYFKLLPDNPWQGLNTRYVHSSITAGLAFRQRLLAANPNTVLICELRYRDAYSWYLPTTHLWWQRDSNGCRLQGWEEGHYFMLDYHQEAFQNHVASQAQAIMQTGVVDGIMLDWWEEDDVRVKLVQRIRHAIGERALILVNTNDRTFTASAPYVNGSFMECWRSRNTEDWIRISNTLLWAEEHARSPRINCLETWFHNSREDLNLMRATTCLALTHSRAYCLFADPNDLPTPDHLHNWYPFWSERIGHPTERGHKRADGSWLRRFETGTAVYNPPANSPVSVRFRRPHRSLATGTIGTHHKVPAWDGDIFIDTAQPGDETATRCSK